MKDEAATRAAALLRHATAASLATLHEGAPAVSMVPYALVADPLAFVVHVSALAAHTRDMVAEPRVALLVVDAGSDAAPPHARARVSLQGRALRLDPEHRRYGEARSAYEARFPDMAGLFGLGDFSLFAIEPASVRVVLGFAQATSLSPATLAAALAG